MKKKTQPIEPIEFEQTAPVDWRESPPSTPPAAQGESGLQPSGLQPSDGSDLMDGQWKQYQWNGIEGLRCVICQWDTLEGLPMARAHATRCPRCGPVELPARSTLIPIADRWGNVVEPTVSIEIEEG